MNRRDFLAGTFAFSALRLAPDAFGAQLLSIPERPLEDSGWRTYEVTTNIKVMKSSGGTRIWVPQALAQDTVFQRTLAKSVKCDGGRTAVHEEPTTGLRMLAATFRPDTLPALTITERVATRNWSVDLGAPQLSRSDSRNSVPPHAAEFLKATRYVPTDGIVKKTADQITAGATTDVEKTRAIYDWIVKNTHRDPKVRGCGKGDIRPMLETGDLGGKCADLNALFVGLVKASGVPARDVYGLRVGATELECSSLGTSSGTVSKAQHCRAEVYLTGFGWVPMDPADVRKVILEEPPGNLSFFDTRVESARERLFGSWEMNWIAYNYAQDVALPGSSGPSLHFFMYPQAETSEGRLDCLDPETFRYEITSEEVASRAA